MNELALKADNPFALNLDFVPVDDAIRIKSAWAVLAQNTQRGYRGVYQRLGDWLCQRGVSLEGLTDQWLSLYLGHLNDQGKAPATIGLSFAAVKWYFSNVVKSDRDWSISENILKWVRSKSANAGRGQVAPLTYTLVDRICSQAELDGVVGLRDSSILRLMSDCLLRVSEVAAVEVEHLLANALHVPRSKTDPTGEGKTLFVGDETQVVIREYIEAVGVTTGALFRRIYKSGEVGKRLPPNAIRRIVKKRSDGVRGVKGRVSGHSLRVGSAVSLAQGGATLAEMQDNGRWKDSRMPGHYASAQLAARSATARIKYGKGRG